MNVLPSPSAPEPFAQSPQKVAEAVAPVRALSNPGERSAAQVQPQGTRAQQEDVIARLNRSGEPDRNLSLKGRRAVAAYGALDQADEQAYMKQVLGFEVRI